MLEVDVVSIVDVWFEDVYQYQHEVRVHNFILFWPLLDTCYIKIYWESRVTKCC